MAIFDKSRLWLPEGATGSGCPICAGSIAFMTLIGDNRCCPWRALVKVDAYLGRERMGGGHSHNFRARTVCATLKDWPLGTVVYVRLVEHCGRVGYGGDADTSPP
jgi:hypothetical protein